MRRRELGPDIATRVKMFKEKRRFTIEELGKRAQVNKNTINALLGGRGGGSSVAVVARVAYALGVRPCWLVFGDGEPE